MSSQTTPASCTLCEAMCGIRVTVEDDRVTAVRGDPDDPFSRGHICPKATAMADLQNDPDRLRQPLRRTAGGLVPVGWDEALDEIADRTHALQSEYGNDAVAAYLGNPNAHNTSAGLFVSMFLKTLRTKNKFSATSLDQLPHMLASALMFGHELLLPVPDLDRTDLLFVIGGNPAVSNGSIMTAPDVRRRLKAIAERGRVVVIDPRRTETAALATEHHPIRPGTDGWLLLGLLRAMFDEGEPQLHHLADHIDGVSTVRDLAMQVSLDRVAHETTIAEAHLRDWAQALRTTPRAAVYGRLGACTQAQGGLVGWLLLVVNALSGHLDREGAMMVTDPAADILFPPRTPRTARQRFDRWRSRVRDLPEFGGELPASTMAEEMTTPGEGQIRGLFVWAGNPVLSAPNGAAIDRALADLDLCVSVDLYVNESARHADFVLPALPPLSRDHYDLVFHVLAIRNTAKFVPAVLPADGDERSDGDIALGLAERITKRRGRSTFALRTARFLGVRGQLEWLLRMGPYGLRRGLGGMSLRKLRRHPHGIDLGPLRPSLRDRMPFDRIDLAPARFVEAAQAVLASPPRADDAGPVLIGRRHLRSNNSWLHNQPRLVKGKPRCTLLVHPDDASRWGLANEGAARVVSAAGDVVVPVEVTDEIAPGVVSLPHGWGHDLEGVSWSVAKAHAGVSVNDLTDPDRVEPVSGNAVLNGVPVTVTAAASG